MRRGDLASALGFFRTDAMKDNTEKRSPGMPPVGAIVICALPQVTSIFATTLPHDESHAGDWSATHTRIGSNGEEPC